MVPLASILIANLVTGQTGAIDVSKMSLSAVPRNPQDPNGYAKLYLVNESGAGLDLEPSLSLGVHTALPANRDVVLTLPPGETSVLWSVQYVLPQVYNDVVLVYFLAAGETPPATGQTGGAQAGNQGRVVALPVSPDSVFVSSTNPAAGTDILNSVFSLSNAVCTAGFAFCYIYSLRYEVEEPSTLGTTNGMSWSLIGEVRNPSNVVIASNTIAAHLGVTSGVGATGTGQVFSNPYILPGPYPFLVTVGSGPGTPFPSGSTYHLRLHSIAVTTGIFDLTIQADVDQMGNGASPGAIGFYNPNIGPY